MRDPTSYLPEGLHPSVSPEAINALEGIQDVINWRTPYGHPEVCAYIDNESAPRNLHLRFDREMTY